MKLKGITKLVLAGTALAATAATLTTSTYAWYVTNSTAKVNGVVGAVKSESSGSLYVAKNKVVEDKNTPQNYQRSVTLSAATDSGSGYDTSNGQFLAEQLAPQSKVTKVTESSTDYYYYITDDDAPVTTPTAKTYYTKTGGGNYEAATLTDGKFTNGQTYYERDTEPVWVDAEGHKTTAKLISFKYWLTTDKTGDATVTFKVDNTTALANVVTQVALQDGNLPGTIAKDGVFAVDAVYALRMSVTKTVYTSTTTYVEATGTYQSGTKYYTDNTGATLVDTTSFTAETSVASYFVAKSTYAKDGDATTANYKVAEIAQNASGSAAYSTASTTAVATNNCNFVSGGDANLYYYGILGEYPWNTSNGGSETVSTGATSWGAVNLTADKDTLLEFEIWLEGSDADCWDSCRGQSFTFDFEFKM